MKLDSGSVSSTISVIFGWYLFLFAHLLDGLINGEASLSRAISPSLDSSSESELIYDLLAEDGDFLPLAGDMLAGDFLTPFYFGFFGLFLRSTDVISVS